METLIDLLEQHTLAPVIVWTVALVGIARALRTREK
jgi:hypothetical protein